VAAGGRATLAERWRDDLDAPTCGGDRVLGRLGEGMGAHPEGAGELAPAEHLDEALVDEPGLPERLRRHLVAGEALEGVEVDDRVLDPEGVLEPLQLGHAAGQRHLAALEAGADSVAGALALHAPARGLAALARDASPDPPLRSSRSGRRLQLVDLHPCTSSTATRWGTRAIIPRISGRSGRTLVRPIRPSPRARSVPRCLGLVPIADRTWVTRRSITRPRWARTGLADAHATPAAHRRA